MMKMTRSFRPIFSAVFIASSLALLQQVSAADSKTAKEAMRVSETGKNMNGDQKRKVREVEMEGGAVEELANSPSQQLCAALRDTAREKRYALKTKELNELKAKVEQRIQALEEKRIEFQEEKAEIQKWNDKRAKFLELAAGNLVEIYSKMRPDAAAGRLEILAKPLAAAILMKLSPRKAGVILNEMKAENAAEITQVIAQSADMGKRT